MAVPLRCQVLCSGPKQFQAIERRPLQVGKEICAIRYCQTAIRNMHQCQILPFLSSELVLLKYTSVHCISVCVNPCSPVLLVVL